MKESHFINKNKVYWVSVEKLIKNQHRSPEEVEMAFKKISHDASIAKTFFYNRSIRVYLNGLYGDLYRILYVNNNQNKKSVVTFWTDTIPYAVYSARKELMAAGIVFLIAIIIGMVSTHLDPEFPRLILGDSYVEKTLENIENGDPMSIYKDSDVSGMTVGITLNNIFVSFLTYVMGIFYMIGSVLILFKNGVMVGAFQYFFVNKGLFWESFLTIWMHGTIEIASIVIAGGAGIVLGRGFAFPGTYSRVQSFVQSARQSIIILISLIPLFIFAGTIEGTVTRITEMNDMVRGLFILLCAAFIVFYYIWYPYQKSKTGFNFELDNQKIVDETLPMIPQGEILDMTGVFYHTIAVFHQRGAKIMLLSLGFATMVVFYIHFYSIENMYDYINNDLYTLDLWRSIEFVFYNTNSPFLHLIQIFGLIVLAWLSASAFKLPQKEEQRWFYMPKTMIGWLKMVMFSVIAAILLLLPFLINWMMFLVLVVIFIPLLGLVYDDNNEKKVFSFQISLFKYQLGINFFYTILLIIIYLLILFLFNAQITSWVVDFIIGNFNIPIDQYNLIKVYIYFFTTSFGLYIMFTLYVIGTSHLYNSSVEIFSAEHLIEEIKKMGKKKQIKGLERE